ncbi:MAG: hypothetical protein WCY19_07500 [Candidatus Gastranaerophilaceae bacterium]
MGTNSLDNLAKNGVINFDADSYIKGVPPRYVGDPDGYVGLPFEQPLPAMQGTGQLSGQPSKDAFVKHDEVKTSATDWKKALMGVILAGLATFGVLKAGKIYKNRKATKAAKAKPAPTAAPAAAQNPTTDKKKFFKGASEKVSKFFKSVPEKWSKLPKAGRITIESLAGLLGLYGIYKLFSKNKNHA